MHRILSTHRVALREEKTLLSYAAKLVSQITECHLVWVHLLIRSLKPQSQPGQESFSLRKTRPPFSSGKFCHQLIFIRLQVGPVLIVNNMVDAELCVYLHNCCII